ncbi:hypothetical protein CKAH01_17206 [Colletotrichum kahawae]|uniref:DUF6604 domain-containing protein n=1 Tax=Colletotrichum kahawae TaxID=34407 RepID=A0AAE0D481_COLKA|nr:hypothetical protein CKAH01_17206 [Colletotrichum kahawae]
MTSRTTAMTRGIHVEKRDHAEYRRAFIKASAAFCDSGPCEYVVKTEMRDPSNARNNHANGHMYWTNMGSSFKSNSGSIERANLDGSDRRVIVPAGTPGVFTPKQITIAKRSQKLYWCDREGMKVMRANLDGSDVEILISTGNTEADMLDQSRWCVGIAVDERRGLFYWTQKGPSKGNQGRILRAPIEPPSDANVVSRDIEVVFERLPEPIDLELDEENGTLYWTDRGDPPSGNSLNRANVELRGQIEILAIRLHETIGLALDENAGVVYVTDLSGGIYAINRTPKMVAAGLRSTYHQYKQDTDVVASWLASSAIQSGYSGPLNGSANRPGTKKLKGRARMEAKKKLAKAAAASPSSKRKHIIAIKDFIPLAEHLADKVSSATLAVPDFFSAALNRDVAGDSQHAHFISVLEKVRETFKSHVGSFDTSGLRSALPTDDVKGDDKHMDEMRTGNMFESLSVYEPSDEFLSAPDAVSPSLGDVEYAVEEEDTQTESLFILSTLLADFFHLREEVLGLWQQYAAGTRDLAAVAVATNTAIKLAHSMEEEVSGQLKKLGGVEELIPMVFGAACAARGLHPEDKRRPTDDYNYRCYAEANMFFYNTLCLLNAYKGQGLSTCPSYNGKFGWYKDDRKAGDDRERWHEDKAALLELFADMSSSRHSRAFRFKTSSSRIYLDVLKSLGSEVRRGEADLKRITNSIGDVVREEPELKKSRLDDLLISVDQWASDKDIFNVIRQVGGLPTRPSNFLGHNPIFCGLHVHDIRTAFHRLGIEFASKGNLLHSVQLYQALRQEGILEEQGKRADLEFIMKTQGHLAFFVGNPPTSLEAYSKNFALTKGISATHWLPNRNTKNKKIPMSRAGIRTINYQVRASMAFAQTFLVDADSRGLNVEVVDLILDSSGWYKKDDSDGNRELETANTNDEKDSIKKKRKAAIRSLSPVELTHQVCMAVEEEVPSIMFNYFGLELTCRKLLKTVRDAVDENIGGGSLSSGLLQQIDSQVCDVVGIIFSAAIGQGLPPSIAPLKEAADAFRTVPEAKV